MAEVRPKALQKQGDGSPWQWQNCAAASAAMAALRARKNVRPTTVFPWLTTSLPTMSSAIRKWCNAHFNTGAVAGLYQSWVNAAIKAMYGVTMGYAWDVPWETAISFIRAHRGCSVSIKYSVILPTAYASSAGFTGRHRVFWNEIRYNSTKGRYEALIYDPLADGRRSWIPKGPQWWPLSLVRKAMEAATIEVSYTPPTA